MGVINKGHTFVSGENVTADKLNNLADDATFNSNSTDGTTLEVANPGGYIKVKDGGIDTQHLADGAVTTAKIADADVTYAKMQNVAANSVIGNPTASGATPQAITIADLSADVATDIGNATTSTNGLMSSADKTKLDGLTNTTYSAGTGLNLTGTTFALDDKLQISSTEVVVNEGGADVDFRVEGDTEPNLLIVDAGLGKVSVNGAYPSGANKAFYVNGDHTDGSIGCTGNIQINTDAGAGFSLFTINATDPDQRADIFNDTSGTINFTRPQKASNETTHLFAANGNTTSITGSYGTISDRDLKENINYLTEEQKNGQVEDIKNLRFAKFNLKGDTAIQLGLIAQDVEQTSPGLVSITNLDGKDVRSVKQSIMHQKAVVALQVALEKIEALEARIEALES